MEQNEDHKNIISFIRELHQQLQNEKMLLENVHEEACRTKEQIDMHFEICMTALMARKNILIMEAENKFKEKEIILQDNQAKLTKVIAECEEMERNGSRLYSTSTCAAVRVWREARKLSCPILADKVVSVSLPLAIINTISKHGSVIENDSTKSDYTVPKGIEDTGESDQNEGNKNYHPCGIYLNPKDKCIYFCDISNSAIRQVNMQGEVKLVAPTKTVDSKFKWPHGIVMRLRDNTFFVTNSLAHTVNKILPSGEVQVLAGSGMAGIRDGIGKHTSFNDPTGITIDQNTGNLYVCDRGNHVIRKISPSGCVSTFAGTGKRGFMNGSLLSAQFNAPWGITFDERDQSLLVCDSDNNKLRRITLNGEVTTFCEIDKPSFVVITQNHDILVSSFATNCISILAKKDNGRYEGSVLDGSIRNEPFNAGFFTPMGLAFDDSTNSCYVADWGSSKIFGYKLRFD